MAQDGRVILLLLVSYGLLESNHVYCISFTSDNKLSSTNSNESGSLHKDVDAVSESQQQPQWAALASCSEPSFHFNDTQTRDEQPTSASSSSASNWPMWKAQFLQGRPDSLQGHRGHVRLKICACTSVENEWWMVSVAQNPQLCSTSPVADRINLHFSSSSDGAIDRRQRQPAGPATRPVYRCAISQPLDLDPSAYSSQLIVCPPLVISHSHHQLRRRRLRHEHHVDPLETLQIHQLNG